MGAPPGVVVLFLALFAAAGCAASVSHPPVLYATGQIMALDGLRVEIDLGTLNGLQRGAVLAVFEVSEEQVDAASGRLARVQLSPVGMVGVHEAVLGSCVGTAGAGADAMQVGHYVRMIDAGSMPDAPWWEDASAWWRAISNRDAIVGTGRKLPFYHGKSKKNRAE